METKKVIEQEYWSDISIEHYDYNDGYVSIFHFELDEIRIEKSKAREVAKAIDPKYQELEKEIQELRESLLIAQNQINKLTNGFTSLIEK